VKINVHPPKMIIYRNQILISEEENSEGDELCSDSFPMKIYKDVFYKFTLERRKDVDSGDYNTGANASAEDGGETLEGTEVEGINAVLNHHLTEAAMPEIKFFKGYIKKMGGELKKRVKANHPDFSEEEFNSYMKKVQGVFKEFLDSFDDLEFFAGEAYNSSGTLLIIRWEGEGEDQTPYGYLPIDGVRGEKQ